MRDFWRGLLVATGFCLLGSLLCGDALYGAAFLLGSFILLSWCLKLLNIRWVPKEITNESN